MDNRLVARATILREWKGSDSYTVVQEMLREYHAQRLDLLVTGTKEEFDHHVGHLMGLTQAIRLVDQALLDETRQRPQEATHG